MQTIDIFLRNSALKYPEKIAVIKGESELSYKRVSEESSFISKQLRIKGIKKGDRVGIYLPKSPEEIISIFGIVKAGAIFVILNPKLKKEQILHIIHDCKVKYLITNSSMYNLILNKELKGTSVQCLLFTDNLSYKTERINRVPSSVYTKAPKDLACIIYTSGSTGKPKGVMIPQKNLIDGADIVSQYLHCKHSDRILSLLPLSFDYGLNQLLTTFKNGATIVLHNFVFPEDVLRTIEKEKITALAGIPTIWLSLFSCPSIKRYDYSSLRYFTNSGGKIPVEYVKKMIKVFKGTKIYLMYGLTEAFRSTYLPPELVSKKPNSIGKAIPSVKISVLNKEGNECKPGEAGELAHRGALISNGYWGNKEATDKIIRELPVGAKGKKKGEKGVFSGDYVKSDKDGFLYYIGRIDETIKSSGYRISPTEIEEVLYKIKGLTSAVVFGVDNPMLGQKIKAVVSCKKDITKEAIIIHCKNNLPDYAVPHEVVFLDEFPKISSGKLDRSLIKETYGK